MSDDLMIRLDDLHNLTGLLPEATPPRMVAEVAQWAVELAESKACTSDVCDCFAARVIEDFEIIEDAGAPLAPPPSPDIDPSLLAEQQPEPPPVENDASLPEASEADLVHLFGAREVRASEPEPEPAPTALPVTARPWTPEEDERLLSMFAAGVGLGEIAQALDRPEIGVNTRRQRLRATDPRAHIPPRAQPWTDADDETLLTMYQSGARIAEIADALGRTVSAVDIRRGRLAKTDPRANPAVKGSAVAAAAKVAKRRQPAKRKPATPAPAVTMPLGDGPVAQLVGRLAELDDNFEPADDELLVRQRYLGVGFADIAAELGCDEATAKARWREILKCGVKHAGGIVTEKGWDELRAAVAQRAAEVED